MAKQGWWNSTWESDNMHLPTRWMYPRFEYSGSECIHCIEFVIGSQPLLQECFSGSHSNIYMWANVDRFKQQGHQVKVTDVKRCSFCTYLQENIECIADLLIASKKQITIQAKLSCCYCSSSTMIWLHSTTCKNGVTLIVQCISQKKLIQLPYLQHGTK